MLASKIKELCAENGVSIRKLERECDIGNGTVGRWDKSSPNLANLQKVADYFGIPVCELLEQENG